MSKKVEMEATVTKPSIKTEIAVIMLEEKLTREYQIP